ncbi:MAG: hypothetical protein J3Q66DRAFT_419392 [Benniella sp.]|nr:MAG: hypothetical protein J3Q66DRAFT_419392 [Benniella sp.]
MVAQKVQRQIVFSFFPSLPAIRPPTLVLLPSQDRTHSTMFKPVSVFDIPLLLDMICAMLDPRDIGNCARCSKEWYSFFGPYRFRYVHIIKSNTAKHTFLLNNSHHIRGLKINLGHFGTFVDPNCNRLQNLTLGFIYEEDEESDREVDEPDDMEPDEIKINKPACAANLIQGSPSLRALHLSCAMYDMQKSYRYARPLDKAILEVISGLQFLTKLEVTMWITCRMYGTLLNHLPQQLQELVVSENTKRLRNHKRCDRQSYLFMSRTLVLSIRHLSVRHFPLCLSGAFIHLLRLCPELEELTVPMQPDFLKDMARVVEVLDSNCRRLHTLRQGQSIPMEQIGVLLKGFSKGFRQLYLNNVVECTQDPEWRNRRLLETLSTTASVNTLEVLEYRWIDDKGEHFIAALKNCTQLRVFRVVSQRYNDHARVDLSDLVESMDESWKCWDTLEELRLKVVNRRAVLAHRLKKARCQRTAQDARKLYLRLRSFPKLTTLAIEWQLIIKGDEIWGGMTLTLDDLNEDAVKSGSETITKEDAAWMGLILR